MTVDASRSCLGLETCVGSAIRQIVVARVLLTAAVPPALPGSRLLEVLPAPPLPVITRFLQSACGDGHLASNGPNKASQFAGDRGSDDIGGFAGAGEPAVARAQPHLSLPGDLADRFGLVFLTQSQVTTDPSWEAIAQAGRGRGFYEHACALKLEGIISKRADAPYAPGNRDLWLKVKCLNREEFVVIGWTDPEGARPRLGALLLASTDQDGRLTYAGRVGAGIDNAELERLWRRLQPLAIDTMPLDVALPRSTRFGSPPVLSRVHWVRPERVAEVKYLA